MQFALGHQSSPSNSSPGYSYPSVRCWLTNSRRVQEIPRFLIFSEQIKYFWLHSAVLQQKLDPWSLRHPFLWGSHKHLGCSKMGEDLQSICMPAAILRASSEGHWRRWFQCLGVFAQAGRLRLTSDFLWGTPKPQASEDHHLTVYHQPLGHRLPLLLRGSSSPSLSCSSNKD